jgi:predicted Ser/Thr protein kinase
MADEPTRIARPAREADVTRIVTRPAAATSAGTGPSAAATSADYFGVPRKLGGERTEIRVGEVLGATFRIEEMLAKGGMGIVYRARHLLLDTEHAVKVILPELAEEEDIIARMTREAVTLNDVKNDAVVNYEGFFQDEQGRRYLVMEYVDGPSLAALLRERRLTVEEVRTLRDRLALGLAAAHDQGVLHRDISPDNIILPGGRIESAKIIDFGIAKSKKGGEHTQIGTGFIGKYSYASPEQFDEAIEPDGRSDIYSLGLVLAAAAIGNGGKLDMGNSLATAMRARQAVPDLGGLPEELFVEISAMLQPRPEDRPQSMRELVSWGMATLHGGEGSAGLSQTADWRAATSPARRPAARRSRRGLLLGVAIFIVAMAAAAAAHVAYPEFALRLLGPDRTHMKADIGHALESFRCATLTAGLDQDFLFRTHVKIAGFVSMPGDVVSAARAVAALPHVDDVATAIQVADWPFCDAIKLAHGIDARGSLRLASRRPDFGLRDGESYFFSITSPQLEGVLYVDLVDESGEVLHLLPSKRLSDNHIVPGQPFVVSSDQYAVVSPPYGKQMVLATLAPQPLFAAPRSETENAAAYLDALRTALDAARDRGEAATVAAGYRLFETAR